ncbi:MAG: ROK family protein [candidate division Zixibacteria bacterium]|nr:ROK family protein [candidate division Zixibacteria bacterium]
MKVRLGIDLGGTFIKAGIIDESFKIIYRFKHPAGADIDSITVRRNLNFIYKRLIEKCDQKNYEPQSLGIGSPGTISQPKGIVTDAAPNIAGWTGTALTKVFGNTKIPVFADNDANCAALAEYLVGFKCLYTDMIFVTVGTGIGGGIIIGGKLHRGSHYASSEIGHTVIRHNGRLCKCGIKGCLEAYASVPNMMKRALYWAVKYNMKINRDIKPIELFNLYKGGNRFAIKTIKENADYLGAGLGSLVNTLNPEILIIGGGFSGTGKEYVKLIKESIARQAFKAATSKLKVAKAKMGNHAGFVGAALLSFIEKNGKIKKQK